MAKRAVASTNLPYFARFVPTRAVPLMPFVESGSGTGDRFMAVLVIAGGVLGGIVVAGVLLASSFIFSFGSSPDGTQVAVAIISGIAVAGGGIVLGVLTYRYASRASGIAVADDHLEIVYKTFKRKLVVPRSAVRLVDIHDSSSPPRAGNARFPIEGALPDGVFADALDNYPAQPWDDLDPRRHPVPWDLPRRANPAGYSHDDPEVPGWASNGHAGAGSFGHREAYLWSGQGSSLPFLRCGPGDAPNVAVVFNTPQRSPRPPWWYDLLPARTRLARFRGGRDVRGFLVRMRHPEAAAETFSRWGVVRRITAEDVLEEGLLVAKPLGAARGLVYTILVVGPLLLGLVTRLLR